MTRTTTLGLLAATSALFFAACGEPEALPDPHARDIARLTQAVEDLTAANQDLQAEVRRQGRQVARLTGERVDRVSESTARAAAGDAMAAAATETASGDSADATDDATAGLDTLPADVVDAVLDTEAGQQAIAAATAREIERREAKERRLFVSYQVGMFAQKAGLDERQTEALQGIWKRSMDRGVELRKQFAAIGQLPESEREAARTEAMQSMREIGRSRREEVGALLSGEQLEMYEEAEEEIVAGLHGAPRR